MCCFETVKIAYFSSCLPLKIAPQPSVLMILKEGKRIDRRDVDRNHSLKIASIDANHAMRENGRDPLGSRPTSGGTILFKLEKMLSFIENCRDVTFSNWLLTFMLPLISEYGNASF